MHYVRNYNENKIGSLVLHSGEIFQVAKRRRITISAQLKLFNELFIQRSGLMASEFKSNKNLAA
jgi:hypothetical protein